MNDLEFAVTETSRVFDDYLDTMNGVLELAGTVYTLFDGAGALRSNPDLIRDVFGSRGSAAIDGAENHSLQGHTTLHSLILLSTWAAFEAMVVDICISTLQADPELLKSKAFEKTALPAHAVLLDRREQIALLGASVFHDNRLPPKDTGKGKFESQLDSVGLAGRVPDDVAKTLVVANAFRNIIAHRGHRADEHFIEKCPDLGYRIDDVVQISKPQSYEFLHAQWTYSIIIINRCRAKHGLRLIQCHQTGNPFAASFTAMFPGAVDVRDLG